MKDMEHQDWLGSIVAHCIKSHPSDDFLTFLTPLILIWHLTHYDSHSLEAVSQSSLSQVINQVIDQVSFHFYPNFPMMSHYYSLSF